MLDAHQVLRAAHIAAGAIGLAAFWIPVFAAKGAPLHRRAGRLFEGAAYAVVASAVVSCAWALVDPLGWAGAAPGAPPHVAARIRGFGGFLGMLSLATLATTRSGILALRARRDPAALRSRGLLAVGAASLAAGVLLLGHAIASRSLLFAALSPIGILTGLEVLGTARRPLATRMSWWYLHMEGMLGAGIAFHTAFLVFGSRRLFDVGLEPPLALVPWLLPTLVGVPATRIWVARYRARFGDRGERPPAAEASRVG